MDRQAGFGARHVGAGVGPFVDQMARCLGLGGMAVTERHPEPIVHTTDYEAMLAEALRTERQSLEAYQALLPMLREDVELYDAIEQIQFAEERSVEELLQLI